jgi:thiol-disulfide isomerase/thioredoxin
MENRFMNKSQFLIFCFALICMALPDVLRTSSRAEDLVDFTLNDFTTKQQICTSTFRGKAMLIIFGSIYCKPCIEMLPVVRQLRDKYEQAGLVVVGIDIDVTSDDEKINQFIKDHQIRHMYLIDTIKVARLNRVFTLPTTLIVNPKGGIEKRLMGVHDYDKLEGIIKKVLPENKGCAPYLPQ